MSCVPAACCRVWRWSGASLPCWMYQVLQCEHLLRAPCRCETPNRLLGLAHSAVTVRRAGVAAYRGECLSSDLGVDVRRLTFWHSVQRTCACASALSTTRDRGRSLLRYAGMRGLFTLTQFLQCEFLQDSRRFAPTCFREGSNSGRFLLRLRPTFGHQLWGHYLSEITTSPR